MGALRSPKLDVQLKCQLGLPKARPNWPYDLKSKNYEDLRYTNYMVPRILIVIAVPPKVCEWVKQDEEQLLMRHCGWWLSLRGMRASTNKKTVRVQIPRSQRFDVSSLKQIMERVRQGGLP